MTTDSLPLFPLALVAYPGETIALHIFEERYKDLVRDCLERDSPFGIVLYDDGRLDIEVVATERFRITSVTDDGSYLRCGAENIPVTDVAADAHQVQRLITQHMKLLELAGRTVRPGFYDQEGSVSYLIARNAGLELPQKQMILETDTEADRVRILIEHMARFIPHVEQVEEIRKKVQSNGHFQDFPPESS